MESIGVVGESVPALVAFVAERTEEVEACNVDVEEVPSRHGLDHGPAEHAQVTRLGLRKLVGDEIIQVFYTVIILI